MNDSQRRAYLGALGIDSYVPRWVLPEAPAPRVCVVVEDSVDEFSAAANVGQTPVSEAVADNERAVNDASNEHSQRSVENIESGNAPQDLTQSHSISPDILPGVESTGSAEAPQIPQTTQTPLGSVSHRSVTHLSPSSAKPNATAGAFAASKQSKEIPRFALSAWRISEDLIVFDSRDTKLALPTDRLLLNLVAALGYRLDALPKVDIFRWPIVESPTAPQGEKEARQMLQAYLDALLLQQPAKYLLVMGRDATHYILSPSTVDGSGITQSPSNPSRAGSEKIFNGLLGQCIEVADLPASASGERAQAIITPSLADMLQQPLLKADTWKAVQPLRLIG